MEYAVRCAINSWSVVYMRDIAFEFGVGYAHVTLEK
jgi:hypothetical protein